MQKGNQILLQKRNQKALKQNFQYQEGQFSIQAKSLCLLK
jgi:hypothetical protein